MRLQRLEIAGFKSFPDRSELTFDSGVTAIVGPNGCGKSNVVDALTWVLGEQSAKSLRGDRMEDVIFGGSDARRPTGAAEVRLKLSGVSSRTPAPGQTRPGPHKTNGHKHGHREPDGHGNGNGGGNGHSLVADGDVSQLLPLTGHAVASVAFEDDTPLIVRDVELMRRLFRSGESEYLIDGEVCRLRDVQDLLMDAGLGVKGYAVIEQGKIGQILSARPTDRRQLIEEAAGVTKYKSRRRSAELKLEAAQQNLTRVDDIVFEVEKQRGALKRQAAKARRYRRLREELRRWEKVQFAERYRKLGAAIEAARMRLSTAREREAAAAARLAEVEAELEALRAELAGADTAAAEAREQAHARELTTGRLQQQIAFDRHQVETLGTTIADLAAEVATLDARREPARIELDDRRQAASSSSSERDRAAADLAVEEQTYSEVQTRIEGLEGDVEAARSEVFAAVNAATTLRHAIDHAAAARARIGEQISKLEVESRDLAIEAERAARERAAAESGLGQAKSAIDELRSARSARESGLATARADRDARARDLRAAEHGAAALAARLGSLEELDAARVEYADGARLVLAESNGDVMQMGSVADYLDVDVNHERAVEACLGDLLQHVVVPTHEAAAAGLRFAADRNAGRVGFLVAADPAPALEAFGDGSPGLTSLSAIVRVNGPAEGAIEALLAGSWLAESSGQARAAARGVRGPIVTRDGEVYRGANIVQGGTPTEARGILATKREIKELRERIEPERLRSDALREAIAALDAEIAGAEAAIASMQMALHGHEKAAVGFELQLMAAGDAADRIARKREQIAVERRTAEEELRGQEARQEEAGVSIARIGVEQQAADARLNDAQRRLFEARETMQAQARRTGEAKAEHAALLERAAALAAEVQRLEEAGRDLEARVAARREELRRAEARREQLLEGIATAETELEAGLREFDELRERVRAAEGRCQSLRAVFEAQEATIKDARRALELIRGEVAQLDVARATAEADLTHLANDCVETVQATLDEVAAEIAQMELEGQLASPRPVDDAPEPSEIDAEPDAGGIGIAAVPGGEAIPSEDAGPMTADQMVADLRTKIDRLGPVNMMAIDQFDDLESRHAFLTGQRKDLIDSIAATSEAIKKIEKTTKERFNEAFTVINANFERTFTTLFGGGRAGLVLLDETDALESGIDIIAQPPGKRLQSIQLLSGGEKALTAMALMFAIFQYRPSPFCLLDEIDAPLDDANIGRFVEMLQGMQDRTQFILITHNRKTMEIADRLYGVTMEEPGVSKLISVRLN